MACRMNFSSLGITYRRYGLNGEVVNLHQIGIAIESALTYRTAMTRKLPWVLNIILASGMLGGLVWFATLDTDTDDKTPKPTTTTTTKPPRLEAVVSPGPHATQMKRIADDFDLEIYVTGDQREQKWELGIVQSISGPTNVMSVKYSEGTEILQEAAGCDGDMEEMDDDYLATLLDPGDIILWSRLGGDFAICRDEIKLIDERGKNQE